MTEQEAIENLRKVRSCGDLISRKALMQSLRNNVLIDVTPNLEQAIEELPTAYDVDKVVDQLSKEYTNIENDELLTSAEKEAVLCRITRDIDIIKAGGVNEKKTEKPDYQNSAGILRSRQRGKETL